MVEWYVGGDAGRRVYYFEVANGKGSFHEVQEFDGQFVVGTRESRTPITSIVVLNTFESLEAAKAACILLESANG